MVNLPLWDKIIGRKTSGKQNHKRIVKHMINRIIFTKKLGKLQEKFIDIDFTEYEDIYVFCDSDPIGYYLSYRHIYYHAVEESASGRKTASIVFFCWAFNARSMGFLGTSLYFWKV